MGFSQLKTIVRGWRSGVISAWTREFLNRNVKRGSHGSPFFKMVLTKIKRLMFVVRTALIVYFHGLIYSFDLCNTIPNRRINPDSLALTLLIESSTITCIVLLWDSGLNYLNKHLMFSTINKLSLYLIIRIVCTYFVFINVVELVLIDILIIW